MKYLLSISIGPVQDFIATARRSRDLWFGSWLLSEVSKAAAKKIDSVGGVLIFPAPTNVATDLADDSEYSVVNKLLAQIETNNIHEFCNNVYVAMLERLWRIANDGFSDLKKLKVKGNDAIHWDGVTAQLNDLIEFYWTAYPFEDSNYEVARKWAEALLAARKVTRNFDAVSWRDNVPKSSLDGLRESVIDEDVFDQLDAGGLALQQKADLQKNLRTKYRVRGKERLCGVGLLKRHGKPRKNTEGVDSFFSTSHVAALPLLNRLKAKDGNCIGSRAEALRTYIDKLTAQLDVISEGQFKEELGHVHPAATLKPQKCFGRGSLLYDGRLLFEERLREFFEDSEELEKAKEALREFISSLNQDDLPHVSTPLPYYAILHADGDRMGAVIDAQATKGLTSHQKLSETLSAFAGDVKRIVEVNHEGSCIFSGGDDVLALLPLHTALQCARDLADKFKLVLKDFSDETGDTPTLSAGIAVVHHLDPLQDSLNLAREAEKTAKKEVPNRDAPEKNALAITLRKRSGVDRTVKGSWDTFKDEGALDARLKGFVYLLLTDKLPDSAAYELRDLALRLRPPKETTAEEKATFLAAQRVEAKRILRRKQPKRGLEEKLANRVLEQFCGRKSEAGLAGKPGYLDQVDLDNWTLANLADEIIVAREFAKAIEQAGTEREFAVANGLITEDEEPTNGDK